MSRENKLKKLKKRRERGQNRHRTSDAASSSDFNGKRYEMISYDVTFEPGDADAEDINALKGVDQDRVDKLGDLLRDDPANAVEPLRLAVADYPGIPMFVQWLTKALCEAGQFDEAEQLIEQNHRNHPGYLYSTIDYVMMLLKRGEVDAAEKLLDNRYDVKRLFPHRNRFHYTEVVNFSMMMIVFLIRKNKAKDAMMYLEIMEKLSPDDPNTARARKMLDSALVMQSLRAATLRLLGKGELPLGQ